MERILEQQASRREELTEAPNPLRKELEGELLRERANIEALGKRRSVLDEQLAELKRRSELLNVREVQLAELARNVQHLESQYKAHVDNLEQARIGQALQAERISSINVIQPATLVERPVRPSKSLGLAAGLLLATVSSFGIAFGLDLVDPTFRSREQVEELLGLPVVASLPAERQRQAEARSELGAVSKAFAASPGGVPYQVLAGRLSSWKGGALASDKPQAVTVAVVNCNSEQRGSVAADLALNATEVCDAPVLLVDADTVRRRAGNHFGANGDAGLAEVLCGQAGLEDCIRASGYNNLSLLASGSSHPSGKVLDLRHVRRYLQPLSEDFGLMIADLPTSETNGTELLAARQFDVVLLVIEAERTRIDDVRKIQRQLSDGGANVMGCILRGERNYLPGWLHHYV
jgi:tyrosine-protein kinase Etk/Wzc